MMRRLLLSALISSLVSSPAASQMLIGEMGVEEQKMFDSEDSYDVGMSAFTGENDEEAVPDQGAANCVSRTGFPFSDVLAKPAEGGWSEVTGWLGDVFFYAGGLTCSDRKMSASEIMIIKAGTSISDVTSSRAIKADLFEVTGRAQAQCYPLSGVGIEIRNLRWFSWDGSSNASDRYYEVIKSANGATEQRVRTSGHVKLKDVVWSPTETTPCAFSGRFATTDAEIRWRGSDRSRISSEGISGEISVPHPKVSMNIDGVSDAVMSLEASAVNMFNVADRNVMNADLIKIESDSSAAGSVPIALMASKYFRTFAMGVVPGLENLPKLFPLDLSNAAAMTDMSVKISSGSYTAEPSIVIPVSMGLNLSSVGITRVGGDASASVRFNGDGKANFEVSAEASQMLEFSLKLETHLRRFDKLLLDSVAIGRTPPDASPYLSTFSLRTEDLGIDDAFYSITGRTIRDSLGKSGEYGFSGAAYAWLRSFRNDGKGSITGVLTSPIPMEEGFVGSLYSAQGNFMNGQGG